MSTQPTPATPPAAEIKRLRASHARLLNILEVIAHDHLDPGMEVLTAIHEARQVTISGTDET
ncbi:MAG: hypothetical protein ACRDRO_03975 [Pseudonocardiaceae bacterium]